MNRSNLRASLGGMYCPTSKPFTEPPKRVLKASTFMCSIGAIPLRPARMPAQLEATSSPSGVSMPRPVTTTRLRNMAQPSSFSKNQQKLVKKKPHRSEEHTSELQSRPHLVCRLLLEKKKKIIQY